MSNDPTSPSQADRIIRKFGGIRPMAKMLGMKNHTTVQRWEGLGHIKFQYWRMILVAAVWNDIDVTLHDFVADLEKQYQLDVQTRNKKAVAAKELEGAA